MRILLTVAAIAAVALAPVAAQPPPLSPHEIHEFVVDGSAMSINYGRPSKRGREIWGALVRYDRWWMPGADTATIFTTADPIVLGGTLDVPKGQHTFYSQPDPKQMRLIVNNAVGQFHTQYPQDMNLGQVDLTLRVLTEPVEKLTFEIEQKPEGGGVLKLIWDDREYSTTITIKK